MTAQESAAPLDFTTLPVFTQYQTGGVGLNTDTEQPACFNTALLTGAQGRTPTLKPPEHLPILANTSLNRLKSNKKHFEKNKTNKP